MSINLHRQSSSYRCTVVWLERCQLYGADILTPVSPCSTAPVDTRDDLSLKSDVFLTPFSLAYVVLLGSICFSLYHSSFFSCEKNRAKLPSPSSVWDIVDFGLQQSAFGTQALYEVWEQLKKQTNFNLLVAVGEKRSTRSAMILIQMKRMQRLPRERERRTRGEKKKKKGKQDSCCQTRLSVFGGVSAACVHARSWRRTPSYSIHRYLSRGDSSCVWIDRYIYS